MEYSISVCIITCDRSNLFEEALQSCLAQSLLPGEIVIGDDSRTTKTQELIAALPIAAPVRIEYRRNEPRLGQNANINDVFLRATGTHIVLLHDDDLLLPNALRDLIDCWSAYPELTASFGKQMVIRHDGTVDAKATQRLNYRYRRVPEHAGLQTRPLDVGISQQFPNDGYMVTAAAAKATLWRSREEVGYGGEYDFGLRLALAHSEFYFLDVYTAKYRLTASGSISGSLTDDAALQSYRLLEQHDVPPESAETKRSKLTDLAPTAITQALRFRKKREAWKMYTSRYFPWSRRMSLGGVRKLLQFLAG